MRHLFVPEPRPQTITTSSLLVSIFLLASVPAQTRPIDPVCEPGSWVSPSPGNDRSATSLGSISIGEPHAGSLFNAVQLPSNGYWMIRDPDDAWATSETIAAIKEAFSRVHRVFTDSPAVCIGDLSDQDGGHLDRHISHQSGRDADIGWYFVDGPRTRFASGTIASMDLPRSWALVRSFALLDATEIILIDRSVQRRLYRHALASGERRDWVEFLFQIAHGGPEAMIRHAPGHRDHFHVRFHSPCARERWTRHGKELHRSGLISMSQMVHHRARTGDSLWSLARRYRTTIPAIAQANGLRSSQIRAGRIYSIPIGEP